MTVWIDFKDLRQHLSFEQVLRHYNVEVKRKGNQHQGFCPLPTHGGKRRSPSFSANLERGIFHCFGCGAKGNVLEFAALMEKKNPEDGKELRSVALLLQERFGPAVGDTPEMRREPKQAKSDEKALPVVVNAPLDFELKGLNQAHGYLPGRGFTLATIVTFGLGHASRGSLKDRIAIPLHDQAGQLVGYAGRVVDDSTIGEENPRYRLPTKRERSGVIHEFRKTLFLYNGYRIKEPVDDLVVVEGFPSVWWFHQGGIPNVVATMGSDCSDEQAQLIASLVRPHGRIWIIPDGDEAGERYAATLLLKLSPHRLVRWIQLAADDQPTDLSVEQLKSRFTL
jgi:DNA primase